MLTRIELTNFMSHESTVIEPAPGLTVLTGPNNCGKSAVVAALQILCHNEPSTYVLRHGEKECAIRVDSDDGHVIEWRRRNSPSYTIDGKLFDRLRGTGLPDELHAALRLPKVDAGNETDFDVHFGTQKAPVFLLNSSPANAARFFASSSDAIRLVQMQRRHREKLSAAKGELSRLESEAKQLNDELERLEPVRELDSRLKEQEKLFDEVKQIDALLGQATRHEAAMRQQQHVAAVHRARLEALRPLPQPPTFADRQPLVSLQQSIAAALAVQGQAAAWVKALTDLSPPPELQDDTRLEQLVQYIQQAGHIHAQTQARCRALEPLDAPPELVDQASLAAVLSRYTKAEAESEHCRRRAAALAGVVQPLSLADSGPLDDFVGRFQRVSEEIWERELALRTVEDQLAAAEAALRQRASGSTCESCGAPLNPDRLLARAAAGWKEHDHEE